MEGTARRRLDKAEADGGVGRVNGGNENPRGVQELATRLAEAVLPSLTPEQRDMLVSSYIGIYFRNFIFVCQLIIKR